MDGIVVVRVMGAAFLAAALLAAAACDLRWRIIPNECVALVAVAWLLVCGAGSRVGARLLWGAAGAATVLVVLLLVSCASTALGNGAGIGGGDVKLLAATSLWVGPLWGLALVGASCVLGLLGHLACTSLKRKAPVPSAIPMAPAIAASLALFVLL